jgi:hypothetical protein
MKKKLETILIRLLHPTGGGPPLAGLAISDQFRPDENDPTATLRNLNAGFLILLCGPAHPCFSEANRYLEECRRDSEWRLLADFYYRALSTMVSEWTNRYNKDQRFKEAADSLCRALQDFDEGSERMEMANRFWSVFFPEGESLFEDRQEHIEALRGRRTIAITHLNPAPIREPDREILFSANVLLTIPPAAATGAELVLPPALKEQLRQVAQEPQIYWYDHPIPMGVAPENNEAVYGLKGLDRAIAYEKQQGHISREARPTCVLSLSVTHAGLQPMAKHYLKDLLAKAGDIANLRIFAFAETEANRVIDDILMPAARHYLGFADESALHEIIGVDGEYGRHYNFLKAIAAFWQVFLDPDIKGTFKIDLDQVFPQAELVRDTGSSALEHFKTALWGARGIDSEGHSVRLDMIAGALVEKEDAVHSVFTPDVKFPTPDIKADEWIFFSPLPQALSTEGEMMTRYREEELNGRDQCLQRIHVTGGTCGILVDSLRRYRPFCPTFVGRAEDQAYLLSVLFKDATGYLRYLHKSGLIMRHDKKVMAQQAIKAARTGKIVGDLIRILLFSEYAKGLPWSIEEIKGTTDPFTGCFISHIPHVVIFLRLALKGAWLYHENSDREACALVKMGIERLNDLESRLNKEAGFIEKQYLRERRGWDVYYDLLEHVAEGIRQTDPVALDLQVRAKRLVEECEVEPGTKMQHEA